MSQTTILHHITGRIKADVDFLVAEGLMSRYDADHLLSNLPGKFNHDAQPHQLASPPPSATTTPQSERSFRRIPIPTPSPVSRIVPKVRASWGYNEDATEPNDLSFPPDAIIELIEETNSDWWKGRYNGHEGLFPSTYVEKIAPASLSRPAPSDPIKSTLPSNTTAKFIPPPAPDASHNQNHWGAPPPPMEDGNKAPEKKSKFGRFGRQAGDAAASGVGFGAGAAIGSGIVNAIF